MIRKYITGDVWFSVYANDLDAMTPEVWAQEALMFLEQNLVAAQLVYRDFDSKIAKHGDTVNCHRPAEFVMKRKLITGDVVNQDADAASTPVVLNQLGHVSFIIRDGEQTKSFANLYEKYLVPALRAMVEGIDSIVLAQKYQFLANSVGKLGVAPGRTTLIDLESKMDSLKIPTDGRNCIITSGTKGDLLAVENFTDAHRVGDDGTAMRKGSIGEKFGTQYIMSQNQASIATGNTIEGATVDLTAGYAVGSTTIAIDGTSETFTDGSWCTIAGDMTPQKITASSGTPTTELTIAPGLKFAVIDGAVITVYEPGAINGGEDEGMILPLTIDGFTVAPKTGQLISFGAAAGNEYGAINTPTTTSIEIDRPLAADRANGVVAGIGPAGQYNFGFHRNAIALVTRPLATPPTGIGVNSFVAEMNGLGLRVTMSYDGIKQGVRVTVDLLWGVKVLDTNLGVLMYG